MERPRLQLEQAVEGLRPVFEAELDTHPAKSNTGRLLLGDEGVHGAGLEEVAEIVRVEGPGPAAEAHIEDLVGQAAVTAQGELGDEGLEGGGIVGQAQLGVGRPGQGDAVRRGLGDLGGPDGGRTLGCAGEQHQGEEPNHGASTQIVGRQLTETAAGRPSVESRRTAGGSSS